MSIDRVNYNPFSHLSHLWGFLVYELGSVHNLWQGGYELFEGGSPVLYMNSEGGGAHILYTESEGGARIWYMKFYPKNPSYNMWFPTNEIPHFINYEPICFLNILVKITTHSLFSIESILGNSPPTSGSSPDHYWRIKFFISIIVHGNSYDFIFFWITWTVFWITWYPSSNFLASFKYCFADIVHCSMSFEFS